MVISSDRTNNFFALIEHCQILCSDNITEINFPQLATIQKLRNFVLKHTYEIKFPQLTTI